MSDDFDHLIESELRQALSRAGSQPHLQPRYLATHMGSRSPMSLLVAIPAKAAVVLAAATLATGGVAAKTVATGTPNPLDWGQKVEQRVVDCKKNLAPGEHGIGDCVSDFARQHGQLERAQHAHGKRDANDGKATPSSDPPAPAAGHPTHADGHPTHAEGHPMPAVSHSLPPASPHGPPPGVGDGRRG